MTLMLFFLVLDYIQSAFEDRDFPAPIFWLVSFKIHCYLISHFPFYPSTAHYVTIRVKFDSLSHWLGSNCF